jgi:hypothetical protein
MKGEIRMYIIEAIIIFFVLIIGIVVGILIEDKSLKSWFNKRLDDIYSQKDIKPHDLVKNINDTDCADRSNGATEKELELASKLNDAKIYIAQLKLKLGYTMSKEEMNILEEEKKNEQN